jgi:Domain of unknown function (DUF222)/HNH endonuclease
LTEVVTSTPTLTTQDTSSGVPGLLVQARRLLREASQTLWAARPTTELMDTLSEAEALKSTLDALLVGVIRELGATAGAAAHGWASTGDLVTAVSGGHKQHGPALVRFADRLSQPVLAPVETALADGWLSTTKVQVIARTLETLPPGDTRGRAVALLLEEAKRLDATDLTKAARHLLTLADPDGADRRAERELEREERAAHAHRHLAITSDQAGGAWIRGRCSAEDAATVRAALMSLAAPRPTEAVCRPERCTTPGCRHGRDPRDHGARMLDALVELCTRAETAQLLPTDHGAPVRLTVLLSFDALREQLGVGATGTGEQLSAAAVRRLACDSEVIPAILGTPSELLDVGQAQRLVTPGLWRALVARDQHCRFPGCGRPPLMCHAHHVRHWADGGPTALANLLLLCGHHHRLVHAGPWRIAPTGPGDFAFQPPPGVQRTRIPGQRPPPRE